MVSPSDSWADDLAAIARSLRVVPDVPEEAAADVAEEDTADRVAAQMTTEAAAPGGPVTALDELLHTVRGYLHLPDPRHLLVALACAVSAADEREAEPLWVLLVGPPSGGKTEALRVLDSVVDDKVDELTVGGLLSWSKATGSRKPPVASGLLKRIGDRGLAAVKDFSTVLATSDRGGREQLFANLRAVYDGGLDRSIANPASGEPLRWRGRLTLLAAVTPVIDEYTSHADALGPRWLYCRLPSTDSADRRRAAGMARRGQLDGARTRATGLAATLVTAARQVVTGLELDDDDLDDLDDAALVTCLGRAAVPRETYGRRDICGVPVVEEPPRVVRQLGALTRSLVALGVDTAVAVGIARRCALDTIPRARAVVLDALADGEPLTVAETARRTGLHRHVARRALEDMQVVGATTCPQAEADEDDDPVNRTPRWWALAGEDAEVLAAVMRSARVKGGGRRSGYSTPVPPQIETLQVVPAPTLPATSDLQVVPAPTLPATSTAFTDISGAAAPGLCSVCGLPLDPALGEPTHPSCELPAEWVSA